MGPPNLRLKLLFSKSEVDDEVQTENGAHKSWTMTIFLKDVGQWPDNKSEQLMEQFRIEKSNDVDIQMSKIVQELSER